MDAQEIINYIATAPKKTPVKAYVKEADGASVDYGSAKVFGAGDKIVFADWPELSAILEANADAIEDVVLECRSGRQPQAHIIITTVPYGD
jgi:2,3,4,5-tetrahydropyridine-2-carboxylate N-succinyltransferase/tetrahydrodipicolinate N-acetyltransferase